MKGNLIQHQLSLKSIYLICLSLFPLSLEDIYITPVSKVLILLSYNKNNRRFEIRLNMHLYRVFNLDWEKVLSFYFQMLLFNDLELIFLCSTMFDV